MTDDFFPESTEPRSWKDVASAMRRTRANMLGTDDEAHYHDCHDAADEIERLREYAMRMEDYYIILAELADHGSLPAGQEQRARSNVRAERLVAGLQDMRRAVGGLQP